ncbi:MAG: c-type cytochrome [Desulfonatronovibrio sp.]
MRSTYLNPALIVLLAVVVAVSIIFGALRNVDVTEQDNQSVQATEGAELFNDKGCSQCHLTGSAETRTGPGLKGLFDRQNLPASGRPVSADHVREQLIDPYRKMPSFAGKLTREEQDRIVAFLKTL